MIFEYLPELEQIWHVTTTVPYRHCFVYSLGSILVQFRKKRDSSLFMTSFVARISPVLLSLGMKKVILAKAPTLHRNKIDALIVISISLSAYLTNENIDAPVWLGASDMQKDQCWMWSDQNYFIFSRWAPGVYHMNDEDVIQSHLCILNCQLLKIQGCVEEIWC